MSSCRRWGWKAPRPRGHYDESPGQRGCEALGASFCKCFASAGPEPCPRQRPAELATLSSPSVVAFPSGDGGPQRRDSRTAEEHFRIVLPSGSGWRRLDRRSPLVGADTARVSRQRRAFRAVGPPHLAGDVAMRIAIPGGVVEPVDGLGRRSFWRLSASVWRDGFGAQDWPGVIEDSVEDRWGEGLPSLVAEGM